MSTLLVVPKLSVSLEAFNRAMRRASFGLRQFAWAMRNKQPTDEENFAFAWAVSHIRSGRSDLAVEDLRWLERRLS